MRVATFNVHGWSDRSGRPTTAGAIELLRSLACDAIVLQEVPEASGTLARVADALGMEHAFAPAWFLGNALLSAQPSLAFEVVPLASHLGERRSAFVARLPWGGGTFTLWGTHLDHMSESDRVEQLEALLAGVRARDRGGLTLLGGDLNALRPADYGADELERIRAHREKSRWEPPKGEVTGRLEEEGWIDLWRLARARDPGAPGVAATCWAGTRIDYLWATGTFGDHARLIGCESVPSEVSDHLPVVAEIAPPG